MMTHFPTSLNPPTKTLFFSLTQAKHFRTALAAQQSAVSPWNIGSAKGSWPPDDGYQVPCKGSNRLETHIFMSQRLLRSQRT